MGNDKSIPALLRAKSYLRKQGPLDFYVQRNPLGGFEKYPFFEGIFRASHLYEKSVLPPREWYQQKSDLQKSTILEKINVEEEFCPIKTYWNVFDEINYVEGKYHWDMHKYKFFSAYFDKGQAYWPMDEREKGLLFCFYYYIEFANQKYLSFLPELKKQDSIENCIYFLLEKLHVPEKMYVNFFIFVLKKIKGWTSYILDLEEFPEHNSFKCRVNFEEFVLINLIIEYSIYLELVDNKKIEPPYSYQLENFEKELKEVFPIEEHISYENTLLTDLLEGINQKKISLDKNQTIDRPKYQLITCIDDREECTRRHFESLGKKNEHITYGYAGHFGIPIMFRGINDAFYKPQCPLLVKPKYYVTEKIVQFMGFKSIEKWISQYSKMSIVETLIYFIFGPFMIISFFFRVINPKIATKIRRNFFPDPLTQLDHDINLHDKVELVYNMINIIGLKDFAPKILICGHGSIHVNNPHKAAYNCAACRGSKGAPNARLICDFANDISVREELKKKKSIKIPKDTSFIPIMHNTSNEDFVFYDELTGGDNWDLKKIMHKVSQLNAIERCKKFKETPFPWEPRMALSYVQVRSMNYSIPRAEYNHAGKTISFIGKREFTRGINLDRRSFLISYDFESDESNQILKGVMSAVIPVLSGISLDYFFSTTNNSYFGSGPKQPHNITSFIGVMNGYKSDLLLGLPKQVVELHAPRRNHVFIQASKKQFETVLPLLSTSIQDTINNQWIRVFVHEGYDDIFEYVEKKWVDVNTIPKSKVQNPNNSTDPRGLAPFEYISEAI